MLAMMAAMPTSPTISRCSGGGLATAPEVSIQTATVLPAGVPARARTCPDRGGWPGGCQRAST